MDETGQNEDVALFIDETGVYIRQWNEDANRYDVIALTHEMFEDMNAALHEGEGMFKIENQ